jgi:hypothetical protein
MPQKIEYTQAEIIRDTLLRNLYAKQEKYWRTALRDIVITNANHHGRTGERYGIHYLAQDWYPGAPVNKALFNEANLIEYLPLHPEYAVEVEKELLTVVNELAQLELEEYECSRFLSGLVLFPAPIEVFHKILGTELFQECEKELAQHVINDPDYHWDANAQAALSTYVAQHDYILKAMKQRLLMNMITRDQIRQ